MEIKKSDKANLDLQRGTGFMLGLIIALSLLFIAFEYSSRPQDITEDDALIDDITEDLALTTPLDNKDMVSVVDRAAPSKALTQNVKEAPQADNTDKIASTTSPLVIGDGEGAAEDAHVVEALPQTPAESADTMVLRTVQQLPEFPGGIVQFMKWLTQNLRYPASAQRSKIQGKVVVSFIVNKDGTIASPTIVTSADPVLDREALRVIKMMPKWKPGIDNGKPCRTMFAIPVNFQL